MTKILIIMCFISYIISMILYVLSFVMKIKYDFRKIALDLLLSTMCALNLILAINAFASLI